MNTYVSLVQLGHTATARALGLVLCDVARW